MRLYLRKLSLTVLIVGLFAFTMPSAAALPVIEWTAPSEDTEWYNINIRQYGDDILDEWIQDDGSLCTAGTCTLDPNTYFPFGLDAADYNVILKYWDADAERIRNIDNRTLSNPTADTFVSIVGGRIEVTIPDNDQFDWVQVWMGDRNSFAQIPDLYQGGWYEKATDMACDGTSCTFMTDAHGSNGNYVAFLTYWDSDTGMGNWSSAFRFSISVDRGRAVNGMTAELDQNNVPTLTWNGDNRLTWYRVWFGGGSIAVDEWIRATDLGCGNGGTCTFTPSVQLPGGVVYAWYIHGWGPAGFPNGGISGSGWAEGEALFIPGSNNAFQMSNGLTVIELESTTIAAGWSLRTSFPGYTGSGYLEWQHGNTDTSIASPGVGVMTYLMDIPAAGRYRFLMRGTSPEPGDAYNDIFFRMLDDGSRSVAVQNANEVPLGNDFAKMYNNSTEEWRWQSSHVDNNSHDLYFEFDAPGEYALQIAGRSNQFRVDRFVVYDEAQVTQNQATDLSNPESPRG